MAGDGMDGLDGLPPGWASDGIMAGMPAMNAAAGQSTLGAVMTPEQIADVDWGDSSDSATSLRPDQQAAAYDGVCRLPDGSLHPYTDAGGGYGTIYGGGNANTNGQAGIGAAANSTAMPTKPKAWRYRRWRQERSGDFASFGRRTKPDREG